MEEARDLTPEEKDILLGHIIGEYLMDRGRKRYALSIDLAKDYLIRGKAKILDGVVILSR